jgi:DNA (cytosine-5)-methyltransferase 1
MIAATMFSGIGAPECAAPHWDWRWHAETAKFPSAVMKARHLQSVNLGDVNAADFCEKAEARGRPDVIVFGSPCQDFSIAGRRVGLDGARGNLALTALGTVKRLKPRWFLFENVPGLFSSYSGSAAAQRELDDLIAREGCAAVGSADCIEDSDFAAFLSAVRECGYLGCYRVLDAQFAGVPQRRRRIFFVGYLGDWRPPVAVLFDAESLQGNPAPSRAPGKGITHAIAPSLTSSGRGVERGGDTRGQDPVVAVDLNPEIAWALQERDHKGADSSTKDGHLIVQAFSCKDYGNDVTDDVSPPLRAMNEIDGNQNAGGQVAIAFQTRVSRNGRGAGEGVVPTLNGADAGATSDMRPCVAVFKPSHYTRGKDGAPSDVSNPLTVETDKGDQDQLLLAQSAVRRLTPRECERLQGFEDDYTLITFRGKPAADGPRYKALGNAMNVAELKWILGRIERFEREVGR